jgi:hypothetical protein
MAPREYIASHHARHSHSFALTPLSPPVQHEPPMFDLELDVPTVEVGIGLLLLPAGLEVPDIVRSDTPDLNPTKMLAARRLPHNSDLPTTLLTNAEVRSPRGGTANAQSVCATPGSFTTSTIHRKTFPAHRLPPVLPPLNMGIVSPSDDHCCNVSSSSLSSFPLNLGKV